MGKMKKAASKENNFEKSLTFIDVIAKISDKSIFVVNEKFQIFYHNEFRLPKLLFYNKKKVNKGEYFLNYIRNEYKNSIALLIKKSFSGRNSSKEINIDNNSETNSFLIKCLPIKERSKIKYVCVSIDDLSEVKKLKDRLDENIINLAETRKLGKLASYKLEYPYGRVIWSQETKNIFGFDLVKNPLNIYELLTFIHPDDKDKIISTIEKSISDKIPFKIIYRFLDGENIKYIQMNGKVDKEEKDSVIISGNLIDVTETKIAEEKIKNILMENSLLLKEIQHHVKNNFQVMLSLLNLQARQIKDPNFFNIFKVTQNRIKTISLIYDKLYQSKEYSQIEFGELVNQIVRHLIYVYNIDPLLITIKIDVDSFYIDLKKAVPCALIVNELVSNSIRYAFPNDSKGEILISLKEKNGAVEMIISDNGIGIPANINYRSTETLGLQLVVTLVNQVDGLVNYEGNSGSKFIITFPL
jgi:two-component sensor histidine kinase